MISYKPSRINNAHIVLPLLLMLAGSIAFFGASAIKVFAPALLQAIALLIFAVAVFIITRYSLTTIYYTVGEDTPNLLVVYRISGKKKTVPVTLDLTKARKIYRPDENTKYETKRPVNMCLNIFPVERAVILFGDADESVELVIEADGEFYASIEEIINNK